MSTGEPAPEAIAGPSAFYRSAWVFYLVLAILGVVWVGWREGEIPLRLFVEPRNLPRDLGMGAAAAFVLVAGWRLASRRLPAMRELEAALQGLIGPLPREEILALAVISGFAEELFFRGAVQGSWGYWGAALLFGVVHSGPGRPFRYWTLFALLAGLLFGWLALATGALIAPMVAHGLVNGVNLMRLSGTREET